MAAPGHAEIMEGSLISCVVPAFNSERFIAEALGSILAMGKRSLDRRRKETDGAA